MNFVLLFIILSALTITKISLFLILLHYTGKINYNNFSNYLLNLSYNSIYYYSKAQLSFTKTINSVSSYVKTIPLLNNLLTYSKDIFTYTKVNDNLTICNKYDEEHELNYKIVLHYNPTEEKMKYIESLQHLQANYKFIMTEISINNDKFLIHFTTDKYNYLIVYNKLNKDFINYFLKTHYSNFVNNLDLETTNYIIKIIDHNVNIIEIDNTQSLYINENEYIILQHNK